MDSIQFNSSTHRIVMYKGKPVAMPLLAYWKLGDLKPDDTVIIQRTTVPTSAEHQYERVKVSELSEVKN